MVLKLKEWVSRVTSILAEQRSATNPLIIHKQYTYDVSSLAGGATLQITGDDIGFTGSPSGYEMLGIRNVYANSAAVVVQQFRLGTGGGQFVRIRNVTSSAASNFTVYVGVNFIRSAYYNNPS